MNLAAFSISRLRLEIESHSGNNDAKKIINLRKTDGQETSFGTMREYTLDYEAEVECLRITAYKNDSTTGRRSNTFDQLGKQLITMETNFFGRIRCYEIGETANINGVAKFRKTENGWRDIST